MIQAVKVYIDEDMELFMSGVLVCGEIISVDATGNETRHDALIDKKQFHSAEALIKDVAAKLKVDPEIVDIDS
jgi:hypothetical protein